MPPEDRVRVQHMREAAEMVIHLVRTKTRQDLDGDAVLRLALVRALEILGEAASRVTRETRDDAPTIPWNSIIGMRNRLSHAYFDIDYDIVWRTAAAEIPGLLVLLQDLERE